MMNIQLPKDLTPAQRAGLKLVSHFILIAGFSAIFAAWVYIDSLHGSPVNWGLLGIVVISQMALALGDAAKKYVSAHGDIPLSVLIGLGRQEVASHSPTLTYTPSQQALKQEVEDLIFPQPQEAAEVITTEPPATDSTQA